MAFNKITRRQLLVAAGGATVTVGAGGLWFALNKARNRRWAKAVDREQEFAPNVFVAIDEKGQTTIWLTKTEMGQGVMTGLPLILAEELGADWDKVDVKLAVLEAGYDYGSMFTAASASTTSLWHELRMAGASAREMLISAAAGQWGVGEDSCKAEGGFVMSGDKKLGFGELVNRAASLNAPLRPQLKDPSQFTLIGKKTPRVDNHAKSTGQAKYGIDARVEGGVFAALLRCPVQGGTLLSVETKPALAVDGVGEVVKLETGVAAIGNSTYAAQEALRFLEPKWHLPSHKPSSKDLDAKFEKALDVEGTVIDSQGEKGKGEEQLDLSFHVPFLGHAPMEPLNCTVKIEGEKCEIWASTQNPDAVLHAAVELTGLAPHQIVVHRLFAGGGFGRRTHTDDVEEALKIALKVKRPVHFVWSREDEVQHGIYREQASHRLMGSFQKNGTGIHLSHRVVSATGPNIADETKTQDIALMGATDVPYAMASNHVEWKGVQSPVRVGIWRAVGYTHNTFALESYIDEVAKKVKRDPLELRLELLRDNPRLLACLEKVSKMAKYKEKRPDDVALGVAVSSCFGSHVAQIAEVRRSEKGGVQVSRVWCAADCGLAINPDTIEAQVEGGIVFGLTAALRGKITVSEGAVEQSNFHDYPLLRHSEMPLVDVAIIKSAESPSGLGELSVPTIAPAVANGWVQLTGKRPLTLPIESA